MRPGLCSITFRERTVDEIIDLVAESGLSSIEWGSDRHVPLGQPELAAAIGAATRDRGIATASLGSYFRSEDSGEFLPVVETAIALGAPRIRVWAGTMGSDAADPEYRNMVTAVLRRAAEIAVDAGITIGLEFHGGTLTDTAESTLTLLHDIDSEAMRTYWQPPVGHSDDRAIEGLRQVLDRVCAIHVFSWWPGHERRELAYRSSLWDRVVEITSASQPALDAFLEFVRDDEPAEFAKDARTLLQLTG